MSEFDVSVIVVNYNAGPMLAACVRAGCRNRSRAQWIVVDNASSDDSLMRLEDEGMPQAPLVIRNERNLGFAQAVNIGMAHARGRALLLLNPDCIVFPGAVDRLLATLDARSDTALVGALVVNIDGSEQRGCRRNEPTPARVARRMFCGSGGQNGIDRTGEPIPASAATVDAVSGAFMMVDHSVMDAIGGMDAGYFLHFEDLDLCRRVRDLGRAVLFEPRALAVHLKSASGGVDARVVERHKNDGLLRYLEKFHRRSLSPGLMTGIRCAARAHHLLSSLRREARARERTAGADDPRSVLDALDAWLAAPPQSWVVVTGATSQVGDFLVPQAARRYRVLAVTRGERAGRIEPGTWWVDPAFPGILDRAGVQGIAAWLHAAPIWLLDAFAAAIEGLRPRRIVAIGSSSIQTKKASDSRHERNTVARLERGESLARDLAGRCGAQATLFRPSMIYGNRNNTNVAFIGRWMRHARVFPIVGPGRGKRQPVHAADVAKSCLEVLEREATFGRLYDLAGSEVVEFKEMIERVFASMSIRPAFVHLPAGALRLALAVAGRMPGLGFLTPAMVERINQDLVFDISPARNDFGYDPRRFEP